MKALVTGAAGFVGSHLVDALLDDDAEVRGIDRFSDYYSPSIKRSNLAGALANPRFELHEADLATADLAAVLDGVDVVFHAAAQAGVRASWGSEFDAYLHDNLAATQRLLEAAVASPDPPRIVYSSSSSVYGNAERYPTSEDDLPAPHSPYGVTKLAAEHLCRLYGANLGVHTVSLRYFTVYGPRQRPDMAFHRLCEAALGGEAFPMLGDGSQIRDFTFVSDVVRANQLAAVADVPPGTCVNVAGGTQVSLREVIDQLEAMAGVELPLVRLGSQRGDVGRTGGSTERAREALGWEPEVALEDGLARQLDHHSGCGPRR
jgi:UDP-glucuronate 4-epimerase